MKRTLAAALIALATTGGAAAQSADQQYESFKKLAAWAVAFTMVGEHCKIPEYKEMGGRAATAHGPTVMDIIKREPDHMRNMAVIHEGLIHYYGCDKTKVLMAPEYEKFKRWVPGY